MSKCISRHGEYSAHESGGDAPEFTCRWCWSFDEDAAVTEVAKLRAQVAAVRELIWQWENNNDSSRKWAAMRLRAALDGEGEQHE